MRILVTGATGVIGRRAVPLMLAAGHQATGVGRSPAGRASLERQGASALALDLFDRPSVRRAIAGHQAVVNLATHVPPGFRAFLPGAWKQNDRIRKLGSVLLVEEALRAGAELFVQESFLTYPDSGDRWVTEDMAPRAPHYNQTSLDAESSALRFAAEGGRGVALRFAYFYGPGDDFTNTLTASIRRGWLPILGRPDGYFSMVTHEDAASAVVAALGAPSGLYNVGEDEPLTRRTIGALLAERLGVPAPRSLPLWTAKLAGSMGDMLSRSLRVSNAKLRGTVGWAPKYRSLREGLRSFLPTSLP